MSETSHTFFPSRRLRPGLWQSLAWWAAAAVLAFVLLEAAPAYAQAAPPVAPAGTAAGPAGPGGEAGGGLPLPVVTPIASCEALSTTRLVDVGGAGSRVTKAVKGSSGGLPACVVDGMLAPSIQFRLVLPLGSWTQRFLQVGCGGLCGRISLEVGAADGCLPLQQGGFAIAATDMGHQDQDGSFGQDAQKREDFAHRAVHLTAVASKRLIERFYGRAPRFAYFSGCSDGGREALVAAQRYPEDFDGILAGAAALNFQVQNSLYHGWQARANTGPDGQAVLTAARLPVLHDAVLRQCDGLDGQRDGLIADPRLCKFDPATIECAGEADQPGAACLSRSEVTVVRQLYEGPRDPQTGERLTAGGPQPGSELGWAGVFVPASASQPIFSERIAMQALQHLVFETDPPAGFKLSDLRFDRATFDQLLARHPLFDATNPDLSRFAARGGKLVIWHGWSDPHISPLNSVAYHQAVRRHLGDEKAQAFERLYLLPGVYHCAGGEGPSAIDLLTPLMAWVEQGRAPEGVVARTPVPSARPSGFGQPEAAAGASSAADAGPPAAERAGRPVAAPVQRSRPVYPYPAVARYKGQGDVNNAENYGPVQGADMPVPAWAGAGLFRPYPVRAVTKMAPDAAAAASAPASR